MTIPQIKKRLSILSVLGHYGLKPDSKGMLRCPFHDDKQPSMKVYPQTNTAYCFGGSCKVSNVDVIDFIMHMEGGTKHEAILKAKALIGTTPAQPPLAAQEPAAPSTSLAEQYKTYRAALKRSKAAQAYCASRELEWEKYEIGYKARKAGGSPADKWGRGCILFPLRDEAGKLSGFYGRAIKGKGHYYMAGRRGLYPRYPPAEARTVVLCESVIDAATLRQGEWPLEGYAILALYGANGLTAEHRQALLSLKGLEEVIFALDGDQAGREATARYTQELGALLPGVSFSSLALPEGEDLNSLAVSHAENQAALFSELFQNRKTVKEPKPEPAAPPVHRLNTENHSQAPARLDVANPYNLLFTTSLARYAVKGGIRAGVRDYDSLKVTLVVENREGRKSRLKLDLYEDKQVEKASRQAGEKLGLRPELLELDIQALTDELEAYREQLRQQDKPNDKNGVQLAGPVQQQCLSFLRQQGLMEAIDKQLEACGLVGEHNNRRLGFCIISSYAMPEPLHGLIQGSSGSGKTYLLSSLCALAPAESYIPITRATDNSFYNYQPYELSHKLISVEDKDAMSEEANLAFRELQTKGMVSSSTTGQDEQGNSRSFVKQVFGPIASLSCTTKGELYLDDMNRCFLLAVDESEAQTRRILERQKLAAAGQVSRAGRQQAVALLQNCLRLLKPYEVVIPYAPYISLPEDVKDKRRLNGLYLALVKQITLLHQCRRKADGLGRLVSTTEDLALANEVMFDAIVLKADELHGPLRSFYEKLKSYVRQAAGQHAEQYTFRQREVRQALRLSRSGLAGFLRELLELEYLQITGGSEHRGFLYTISYWDDNEALRGHIKAFLAGQIKECARVHKKNMDTQSTVGQ